MINTGDDAEQVDLEVLTTLLELFVKVFEVDERVPQTPSPELSLSAGVPLPTTSSKTEEEVMTSIAAQKVDANGKVVTEKNVDVERHGKKIIIPDGMKYAEAREWLARKEKSEEEVVSVQELVETFPLDGSYAFMKAMSQIYGWTDMIPTPSFWGPNPPMMISLQTNVNEHVQVLWGRAQIPNVDGYLETGFALKDNRLIFRLGGQVKRKHLDEIKKIAELTREIVAKESVYKGKAIRVNMADFDPASFNPDDVMPTFFDTTTVRDQDLVFPKGVQDLVDVNLFTPITQTQECRKHQIPLKRGILLEGPYGVGKTLTADVTAKKAVENGWTFIYLDDVKKLQQAIYFAQQYQPAVVFAEDIDSIVAGNDRDDVMNEILNTIDGVDTKHSEVMVVLTTNHVEAINKAMIRPGRLDAVIPVRPPDAEAVSRLIRLYGRTLISASENISLACERLNGQIPAVIREVVERAKLASISRRGRDGTTDLRLMGEDLAIAANGMLAHLELMATPIKDSRSDIEKAADRLATGILTAVAVSSGKSIPNGTSALPAE